MSHQLVIPPEVEHQITGAFDSFDSTERALSFVHDLNALFGRIVDRPHQFPVIYAAMRRALQVDADRRRAVIHAVVHQHRDPALWPR